MKVLITTLGRSHFIQLSSALIRSGVDAYLFQGWIVRNATGSKMVRLAMKIVGRGESFIYGMTKRITPELKGRNIGDFWAEFIQTVLTLIFGRLKNRNAWNFGVKVGFWLHGRKMAKMLKSHQYQIAHIKSGLGRGGAIRAARECGVKVVVDHGAGAPHFILDTVEKRPWGSWSYWYAVQQDCDEADLLIVNSDWIKETFLMYGYPAEKIRVVYMGLDTWFNGLKKWDECLDGVGKSADKPLRIVFSGPFAPHKGNHDFLEAIEKLIDAGMCLEVDVLGAVDVHEEDRRKHARVIAKIKFHGHLAQDKMCVVMKKAHIYLFPSLSEGCAKSAFEAMSMGLCVVASKQSGVPIRDGIDGHIISIHDSDSIVKKIEWLVEQPAKIAETGRAATEALKKYTWEVYAENVKKVYAELCPQMI